MNDNYQANMGEVRISKEKLIEIIKENKAKHDKIYVDAVKGYWQKAEETLSSALNDVKVQKRPVNDTIYFSYPDNYASEYETAIQQLELSVDNTITLSNQEFKQYIRNEWQWKKSFLTKSSLYANVSGCAF